MTPDYDPVDEVRRARERYAARFGFDLRAIAEDLRNRSATRGTPTVDLAPPDHPTPSQSQPAKRAS